jgi:hypothetical protein
VLPTMKKNFPPSLLTKIKTKFKSSCGPFLCNFIIFVIFEAQIYSYVIQKRIQNE